MSPSPDHEHRRDPSLQAPAYVRNLAPYIPGKPVGDLAREFGLAERDIVKLASNENPRGPSAAVRAAIAEAIDDLSRYPDGNGFALKSALSERYATPPDGIVLGNGSNDILELVTQAFLRPGDQAVYSRHAFAVYPLAVQARGATGIEVPARDFGHDLPAMRAAITPATRVVFVANPNNPTGTWIAPDALEAFIASVPADVLVVLDAAYDEYLEHAQRAPFGRVDGNLRQSHRLADLLEGLRPGRAARRLRDHERGRCGNAEPRAPAVQRQRARAGGGARGARRHRLRRREPRAQPHGHARARGRRASARPRVRSVARQLPAAPRRRCRASVTGDCWSRASSCARSPITGCRSTCGSPSACQPRIAAFSTPCKRRSRADAGALPAPTVTEGAPRIARLVVIGVGLVGGSFALGPQGRGLRRHRRRRRPRTRESRRGRQARHHRPRDHDRRRLDARARRRRPRAAGHAGGAVPRAPEGHGRATAAACGADGRRKHQAGRDRRRAIASGRGAAALRAGTSDRRHRAHRRGSRVSDAVSRPQRRADAASRNGSGCRGPRRRALDRMRRPGAGARCRNARPDLRRRIAPAAPARVRARRPARGAPGCRRGLPLTRRAAFAISPGSPRVRRRCGATSRSPTARRC